MVTRRFFCVFLWKPWTKIYTCFDVFALGDAPMARHPSTRAWMSPTLHADADLRPISDQIESNQIGSLVFGISCREKNVPSCGCLIAASRQPNKHTRPQTLNSKAHLGSAPALRRIPSQATGQSQAPCSRSDRSAFAQAQASCNCRRLPPSSLPPSSGDFPSRTAGGGRVLSAEVAAV
jgi:hypothetical protein